MMFGFFCRPVGAGPATPRRASDGTATGRPALLRQRPSARGRETLEEIAERVERARRLSAERPADAVVIDNSGELDMALVRLAQVVLR
ncbi:hypothetical protein ACFS3C_13085 [Azotobacter vinelandii]